MNKAPKVQNRSTKGDGPTKQLPRACADEYYAVLFMEAQRWEGHPACPRCGSMNVYAMKGADGKRASHYRWRCRDCKGATVQFTVRTGTVFEDSKIPLRHWCFAYWRACSSKKGVSALEIHRQTGVSYKSALFMLHRIRFGMADSVQPPLQGTIEVDETFVGGKPRYKSNKQGPRGTKTPVVAMVERGGQVKTKVVANVTAKTLRRVIAENVDPSNSRLMTDQHPGYIGIGRAFEGGHQSVNHARLEYARGDVTTNTVEGFFSIVKRGLNGIYHAVSKKHLHRYMAEFEFRYNRRDLEDGERIRAAIQQSEGKRLLYREPIAELDS